MKPDNRAESSRATPVKKDCDGEKVLGVEN